MRFLNPVTAIPEQLQPGDKLCLVVVASVGQAKDWAAYAGLADW